MGGGGQYKDLARLLFRAGFITLTSTCLRIHKRSCICKYTKTKFNKKYVTVSNIERHKLTSNAEWCYNLSLNI